jgi:hypothetical protein
MRRVGEESPENSRIMLGLLNAVEQDRALASELRIVLGLVNAYLKRCIKKDLVKVRSAPARRYAYYLTPQQQKGAAKTDVIGLPVFEDFEAVSNLFDAVLITDVLKPRGTCEASVARFGVAGVLVPDLLHIRMRQPVEPTK